MGKILSIIIPTYNMEKYLRKCLDSLIVCEDNMKMLEVLVVNDGSKDSSSQIAHDFESRFPNTFRVIDKENGNYGSCINRGLKEAIGKYVKVLDADDYFDTKEFEKFILQLKDTDADLILTHFNIVAENGDIYKRHIIDLPYNNIKQRNEIDPAKVEAFSNMQMHSITYRRNIFDGINYHQSEGISYTDQEWIFAPMYQVKTVLALNYTIYQYLVGRVGQTMDSKVLAKSITHTVQGFFKMVDDYASMEFQDEENRYFKQRLISRMKYIYHFYLMKYHKGKNIDESALIDFDDKLKSLNSEVYQWGNEIAILKIHYVSRWRKNHNDMLTKLLGRILFK